MFPKYSVVKKQYLVCYRRSLQFSPLILKRSDFGGRHSFLGLSKNQATKPHVTLGVTKTSNIRPRITKDFTLN